MMALFSLLGIIGGLALITVGVMYSISMVILVPLAVLLIAFSGGLELLPAYAEQYMQGFGSFLSGFFPLFLTGALFGRLMEDSGVTKSIAKGILKHFGEKHIVSALFVSTFILTIGGVSAFVIIFTMLPMASAFYKRVQLPKKLIPANILAPVVAAQMSPGTPELQNTLPTALMGVEPYAAPIMGFMALVLVTVLGLLYLNKVANKLKGTATDWSGEIDEQESQEEKLPWAWTVVLPIGLTIVLLNVFEVPAYASLAFGSLFMYLLYFKYYKNIFTTLNMAAKNSQVAIVTASIVGLGGVVKTVPGFELVKGFLSRISLGNPLLYAMVAVNVLAAVTGSATGGMSLTIDALGETLKNMGAHPAAVARIIAISSLGLDSLPHNSAIVLTLSYCGVSHRDGYKYLFVTTCCLSLLAGFVGVFLGSIGLV